MASDPAKIIGRASGCTDPYGNCIFMAAARVAAGR